MNSDMTVHPDTERAFKEAVETGFPSRDPDNGIWAGPYMYMLQDAGGRDAGRRDAGGRDAGGRAHFRHTGTRRCMMMPASPRTMTGGGR